MDMPDQVGPFARHAAHIARSLSWALKTAVGSPRRVLVETRWRLGDEIMMLPVFESLRERYPADYISVLTHFPELFENHPFVDAVNEPDPAPDRYILLRGAPRTEYRLDACARHAGVRRPLSRPHLYYADWSAPQLNALPEGNGPIVVLAPGTTWPTKRWPDAKWRALCAALEAHGCRIVELGRGHEPLGVGLCLVDRTSIREAACILHQADLLVSCDSGLMHLALAAGTAVVALFGPTDPSILIRDEPNFHPIIADLPCKGYWNRPGPEPSTERCPLGHTCCLDAVSVEVVLDAVSRQISLR